MDRYSKKNSPRFLSNMGVLKNPGYYVMEIHNNNTWLQKT